MRFSLCLVPMLAFCWAPGASAQRVEITPFAALPFGGEFESDRRADFPDFDIDDGSGYGLSVGYSLTADFQLELFFSRQESDLLEEGGFLFSDVALSELDIDYFHVGVIYQWGDRRLRPFLAGSLGITEFDPVDPSFESETRFSVGAGAGAKVFLQKNFGLRFEARVFTTVIDDGDEICDRGFCYYDDGTYFLQAELRGGLIFAF